MSISSPAVSQFLAETSKTSDFYSDAQIVQDSGFAIQCVWAQQVAAFAGTITLQATINGTTWSDVLDAAGNTVQLTMSGSGNGLLNGYNQYYPQIRLKVEITGGTGTVSAWMSSKYN